MPLPPLLARPPLLPLPPIRALPPIRTLTRLRWWPSPSLKRPTRRRTTGGLRTTARTTAVSRRPGTKTLTSRLNVGPVPERDPTEPGAGEVTASVVVRAPAQRVFDAFVAWERQGEWIPMTKVRVVSGDGGVGTQIEAITAFGPVQLRDEMRVDKIDPPYEVRVVHCGRLLRGPGVMRCTPLAGGRTQMVWHEWFQLPGGLPGRMAWPILWPGSKLSLQYALRRFARLVEAGALP
jgi:hypothetical protein